MASSSPGGGLESIRRVPTNRALTAQSRRVATASRTTKPHAGSSQAAEIRRFTREDRMRPHGQEQGAAGLERLKARLAHEAARQAL